MKKLSFSFATLVLGIAVAATAVQASPRNATPNFSRAPAAIVEASFFGANSGTVCRNGNQTCPGRGEIGWFCQCPTFSGWYAAW